MQIEALPVDGFEAVRLFIDQKTGLTALIALHCIARGPAIGGCRIQAYDDMNDALDDVLQMARMASFQTAMVDVPFGGGKAIIVGDPKTKPAALMRSFGRAVASFQGAFFTCEDSGTTRHDMDQANIEAASVLGCQPGAALVQADNAGRGVFLGMRVAIQERLGSRDWSSIRVAVQGLGQTGMALVKLLQNAGAQITAYDPDPHRCGQASSQFGVKIVGEAQLWRENVDVLAPCAIGHVICSERLDQIKAPIIAGSANQQLADAKLGTALAGRNILYAPDFVINAGGIITAANEAMTGSYDAAAVDRHLHVIPRRLEQIFAIARRSRASTHRIAEVMAQEFVQDQRRRKNAA